MPAAAANCKDVFCLICRLRDIIFSFFFPMHAPEKKDPIVSIETGASSQCSDLYGRCLVPTRESFLLVEGISFVPSF